MKQNIPLHFLLSKERERQQMFLLDHCIAYGFEEIFVLTMKSIVQSRGFVLLVHLLLFLFTIEGHWSPFFCQNLFPISLVYKRNNSNNNLSISLQSICYGLFHLLFAFPWQCERDIQRKQTNNTQSSPPSNRWISIMRKEQTPKKSTEFSNLCISCLFSFPSFSFSFRWRRIEGPKGKRKERRKKKKKKKGDRFGVSIEDFSSLRTKLTSTEFLYTAATQIWIEERNFCPKQIGSTRKSVVEYSSPSNDVLDLCEFRWWICQASVRFFDG